MMRNKSSKTEGNVLNKDIDVKKKRLIRKIFIEIKNDEGN
jgi:hypothetical protein